MEISINDILLPTLEKLARENNLTPEEYATNIVTTFLEAQYRASILDKIKEEPIENLASLKEEKITDLKNLIIKK